ncbi:MAG: hypothetical protein RIQ33_2330 [Bacteroidota bacterium]|jgi:predicted ATPase
MIKNISIQNFFSFGNASYTRVLNNEVSVLVGINGSGKSNFIRAIQLLYDGIAGIGFEKIFSTNWGSFSSVSNLTNELDEIILTYQFDKKALSNVLNQQGFDFQTDPYYRIRIKKNGKSYLLNECIYDETEPTNPITHLNSEYGEIEILNKNGALSKLKNATVYNPNELILRQLSDAEQQYSLFTIKKAIEQISIYNYFDTTAKSPIRELSPYYSETKLLTDGINLTFLLNYLNGNETVAYDKIIEELKNVNPNFRELVFSQPTSGKTLLGLKEKNLKSTISIENLSDGTIRFLILLAILYNPNRGNLVCIDEPEIGLHPDMINTIAKGIKHAANTGTQMIVATHSPLLLNNFDLEDLMIFEKNTNNCTDVRKIREANFKEWEGEFLVGQMWLSGKLGGVRW